MEALLRLIPANASVSAQAALIPRLAHRRRIYAFPNPFQSVAYGYGGAALRQMELRDYAPVSPAKFTTAIAAGPVEYVALSPSTTTFPLLPGMYLDYVRPLVQSRAYGIVVLGRETILLRRGADHEQGLRLLAQRAGMPISGPDDVGKALQAWLAGFRLRF